MKFDHTPDQDYYLYTATWDAARDRHLLRRLLEKKKEGLTSPPHKSPHVLIDVLEKFNEDLRTSFRVLHLEQRLEFLERRFTCFKSLMMMAETQWDATTNRINATDEVWEKIFEDNWLAQVYIRAGEPEFDEMCMLLAPDDIKPEVSHTLVLINDSPHSKKITTINLISSSPDTEVNSPDPPPPKCVVRKLCYEADDAMSSAVPWPKSETRMSNATGEEPPATDVRAPATNEATTFRIGGESSCASSSPFK